MEKQKKSFGTIALVVLLLIVTVVSLILATYAWAKYTTTTTGSSATANVAKWNPTFDNTAGTFVGTYSHVADTKIAPGTSGTLIIAPVINDTEVCYDYTITVTSVELLNGSTTIDNGTIIKAAEGSDAAVTIGDVLGHISFTCGNVNLKTTPVTGSVNLGSHNSTSGVTYTNKTSDATSAFNSSTGAYTFTWNWPYEGAEAGYDRIDTAAGEYAASNGVDLKLKVNYSITATQVNPAYTNAHEPQA